jgi:hypothetical protein
LIQIFAQQRAKKPTHNGKKEEVHMVLRYGRIGSWMELGPEVDDMKESTSRM